MLHVSLILEEHLGLFIYSFHATDLHKLKLVHTDIKPENVMLVDATSQLERFTMIKDKGADKQVNAVIRSIVNLSSLIVDRRLYDTSHITAMSSLLILDQRHSRMNFMQRLYPLVTIVPPR